MVEKPVILFLCTGNSARSQMAEALLRSKAGDQYTVLSAGLSPRPVNPLAVMVMDEMGIDIRGQESKSINRYLGRTTIHTAICVCARAEEACPHIYPFALRTLSWPFEDPAAATGTDEEKLVKFREVREHIDARIREWLVSESQKEIRHDKNN